jgi:hypothetical protein
LEGENGHSEDKKSKIILNVDFEMTRAEHSRLLYLLSVEHYGSYKTFKDLNKTFSKIKDMFKITPVYKTVNLPSSEFAGGPQADEWDCLYQRQFCVQKLITSSTPMRPIEFLPMGPKPQKHETDPKKALVISKEAADQAAEAKDLKNARKAWQHANYSHETVRQICIYESDITAWFAYMGSFSENCFEYDEIFKRPVLVPDIQTCGSNILQGKIYAKIRKPIQSCLSEITKSLKP